MGRTTLREVSARVAAREAFEGNSISGEVHTGRYVPPWGNRLDSAERERLAQDAERAAEIGESLYVVLSYATPIAWGIGREDLYKVSQRFSVTTSRHFGTFGVAAK